MEHGGGTFGVGGKVINPRDPELSGDSGLYCGVGGGGGVVKSAYAGGGGTEYGGNGDAAR